MSRAAPHHTFCLAIFQEDGKVVPGFLKGNIHGRSSTWKGCPAPRAACNQHLSWSSLMMPFTVPLVACVSSVTSLTLCLLPSPCLGVYGHSSQESSSIFSALSLSVLKLLVGIQLLSSEPVDCHGAQCPHSSGQNQLYRVQPPHPSPHNVPEPLGHTSSLGFLSRGPTSGFFAWKAVCRLLSFSIIGLIGSRAACQIRKVLVWA